MSNCSVSRRNRQQRPGDSGYAQILRTLLFLSIPTIVEEVLATLLQYVDTAMVGQLGEQATASVSITTNVTWLVNSAAGAVGTVISVRTDLRTDGRAGRYFLRPWPDKIFVYCRDSGLAVPESS